MVRKHHNRVFTLVLSRVEYCLNECPNKKAKIIIILDVSGVMILKQARFFLNFSINSNNYFKATTIWLINNFQATYKLCRGFNGCLRPMIPGYPVVVGCEGEELVSGPPGQNSSPTVRPVTQPLFQL